MATIREILERQAQAVKANFEKNKRAEQLEAQARALREQANKPVMVNLKEIRKAKDERLERIGNAFAESKKKEAATTLSRYNWALAFKGKEETRYGIKDAPGFNIRVKGGKFSVHYYNEERQQPLELNCLESYLSKFQRDLK
jgi:hypothetical protein